MVLLARLTSRSSRSIAVMIAFARGACGGRAARMGSPDDGPSPASPVPVSSRSFRVPASPRFRD